MYTRGFDCLQTPDVSYSYKISTFNFNTRTAIIDRYEWN